MYIEFVMIYIGVAIIIALCLANIVISIITLKKVKNAPNVSYSTSVDLSANSLDGEAIAYCSKCASKMNTWMKHCPKCGAAR